jgi:hypothetical protein
VSCVYKYGVQQGYRAAGIQKRRHRLAWLCVVAGQAGVGRGRGRCGRLFASGEGMMGAGAWRCSVFYMIMSKAHACSWCTFWCARAVKHCLILCVPPACLPLFCRCLDALVTMGVLVPTGDKLAVKRTAQFFLNSFQVRHTALMLKRGGSCLRACIKPGS